MTVKKKKGGRKKGSRRSKKLTSSQGVLKSEAQVSHLDGLSLKHQKDVADAHRQRSPEEIETDEAEAKILRQTAVSPIEAMLADEQMMEAFFNGVGDRPELVTNFWFGDAGAGHISPIDGHPGYAVVMPGQKWQELIMRADRARMVWKDKGNKLRRPSKKKSKHPDATLIDDEEIDEEEQDEHSEDAVPASENQMSGQLHKIYARVPPWLGRVGGGELSPGDVRTAVQETAIAFSAETGRRVIAANVHRESDYDLHIHLIHTDVVPTLLTKPANAISTAEKKARTQRTGLKVIMKEEGIRKPSKPEVEKRQKLMWEDGTLNNPHLAPSELIYCRCEIPEGSRQRRVAMGPAYVAKTWLWETSQRSSLVAAVNEQPDHFLNFRSVVIEAAKREIAPLSAKDAGDVYIDYWLSKTWAGAIQTRISEEGMKLARHEAAESVKRYLNQGRGLPGQIPEKEITRRLVIQTQSEKRHRKRVVSRLKREAGCKRKFKEVHVLQRKAMTYGLRSAQEFLLKGQPIAPPFSAVTNVDDGKSAVKEASIFLEKASRRRGLAIALSFLTKVPAEDFASEELEAALETHAEAFKNRNVFATLSDVSKSVFPKLVLAARTSKEFATEFTRAIQGAIAAGYQAVMDGFSPGRKIVCTDEAGMKKELMTAGEKLRESTIMMAWDEARRELRGPEAGTPPGTLEEMREEIRDAVAQTFTDAEKRALSQLAPVTIAQLAEKLKFEEVSDVGLVSDIESGHGKILHRLQIDGESFELSIFHRGNAGGKWEKKSEGKGALSLIGSIATTKLSASQICERLAELFPDRWAGILLEVAAKKNPKLWRAFTATDPSVGSSDKEMPL